ncbi:MAG: hypothetical protein QNJ97_02725 [Myxococcota bacterium]|nr:hypothetical protein [Myxococcota bacterium]
MDFWNPGTNSGTKGSSSAWSGGDNPELRLSAIGFRPVRDELPANQLEALQYYAATCQPETSLDTTKSHLEYLGDWYDIQIKYQKQ